jgi:hypothetical protein
MTICNVFFFQYDGQSDNYSKALDYMNMVFTAVFAAEFLFKLVAFRFKVSLCCCLFRRVAVAYSCRVNLNSALDMLP